MPMTFAFMYPDIYRLYPLMPIERALLMKGYLPSADSACHDRTAPLKVRRIDLRPSNGQWPAGA
jgi:hypothetical protein